MHSTGSQTNPVKVLPSTPEVCIVSVQTNAVKICAVEENVQVLENLLTPFVSAPLRHFFEMKAQSTAHLTKLLNSMKCIESSSVLSQ